ncbi:MAG: hypothetical protein KKF27_21040, partial [Gammaproteobacteria bacterium]|nr:hypothetical protein [Gammaproteobacteria bacterium]
MGCGVYWSQVREIERALGTMTRFGIPEVSEAYKKLYGIRARLLAQVGFKFPRTVSQLVKMVGLSPGTVTLWHDIESGWMSEARAKPGAPPVYRSVPDEVAMAILKGELTKELEQELM